MEMNSEKEKEKEVIQMKMLNAVHMKNVIRNLKLYLLIVDVVESSAQNIDILQNIIVLHWMIKKNLVNKN